MEAVGQAAGPWLPLHQVVKRLLSELGERKDLSKLDQHKFSPAPPAES